MANRLTVLLILILVFFGASTWGAQHFQLGERTLYQGDEGVDVVLLQRNLARLGLYYTGDIDGIFGPVTERAVKELQSLGGLIVDGIVGPETLALFPFFWENFFLSDVTGEELMLVARVIHGEARGETFQGQVAVGAVILNRVMCPAFPNSIKEVIMERGQFSSITDGQFNLQPSETAIKAAQAAFMGYDPTRGALLLFQSSHYDTWHLERTAASGCKDREPCVYILK